MHQRKYRDKDRRDKNWRRIVRRAQNLGLYDKKDVENEDSKANGESRLGMADDINSEEKEENRRAARVENGENDRLGRDKDLEDKVIRKDRQGNREASNKDSEEQKVYIVKEEVKEVEEVDSLWQELLEEVEEMGIFELVNKEVKYEEEKDSEEKSNCVELRSSCLEGFRGAKVKILFKQKCQKFFSFKKGVVNPNGGESRWFSLGVIPNGGKSRWW